jgi:hypothetical protein
MKLELPDYATAGLQQHDKAAPMKKACIPVGMQALSFGRSLSYHPR